MWWRILFLVSLYKNTSALSKLNATEYALMPPLFELDDYDACRLQGLGVYCLTRVDLFDTRDNPLMDMIHEFSKDLKHYNHSYIEKGVCIRTTCKGYIHNNSLKTEEDITEVLQRCLNDSLWREYGLQAKVSVYNCDSKEETDGIDSQDWMVAAIFGLLAVVTVIASYHESALNKSGRINTKGNKYLLCFSIQRNWTILRSTHVVDTKYHFLRGLNGMKVILSFFVISVHIFLLYGGGFQSNPQDFEKFYELPLVANGMSITQVHFFISGFLLVYILHIQAETRRITWSLVSLSIILRLSRLVPAYAAMLALSVTWLRHLGSGALWNHFTMTAVADCRTYWWHHLLFINNYFPENRLCAVQTWHLAAGMQLFVVGLVVCVATMSRGRSHTLLLLFLLGCLAPAVHVWLWDLDGTFLTPEFVRTRVGATYNYLYVYGHTNLQAFVISLGFGKRYYDAQRKGVQLSISKVWSILMRLSIPVIMFCFYLSRELFEDRSLLLVRMLLPSLQAVVMSAFSVIFTIEVLSTTPSFLKTVLEWPAWSTLSRLSYCVFLLHMHLIQALLGNRSTLTRVTFLQTIVNYFGVVSLSFLAAVPLYLLVEAPFTCLGKLMLSTLQGSSRPTSSLATETKGLLKKEG